MKITRQEPLYLQSQPTRKQSAPASQSAATTAPSEAKISGTAQSVAKARTQLSVTADVDMEKVNKIRQSISEGKLELDMEALSQAIMDMHRR